MKPTFGGGGPTFGIHGPTFSRGKSTSEPTYIGWNEFVANPWIISEIAIPVFVIFPILLFIYSKKYNWSNWSDKLTGKVNSLPVSEEDVWDKR